jgi:hypothetical protein
MEDGVDILEGGKSEDGCKGSTPSVWKKKMDGVVHDTKLKKMWKKMKMMRLYARLQACYWGSVS